MPKEFRHDTLQRFGSLGQLSMQLRHVPWKWAQRGHAGPMALQLAQHACTTWWQVSIASICLPLYAKLCHEICRPEPVHERMSFESWLRSCCSRRSSDASLAWTSNSALCCASEYGAMSPRCWHNVGSAHSGASPMPSAIWTQKCAGTPAVIRMTL